MSLKSVIQITDFPVAGYHVAHGGNHRIYLQFDNEEEIRNVYETFKVDGKVDSELQKAFFGALLAVLTDKLGVNWNLVYFLCKITVLDDYRLLLESEQWGMIRLLHKHETMGLHL